MSRDPDWIDAALLLATAVVALASGFAFGRCVVQTLLLLH